MKKHIHKYHRNFIGKDKKYKIYECTLPGCTHYLDAKLIKGKMCLCHKCESPMVVGKKQLKMAYVRCENCIEKKNKDKINNLEEFLNEVL